MAQERNQTVRFGDEIIQMETVIIRGIVFTSERRPTTISISDGAMYR